MTIKEYLRKNYAYLLHDKPCIICIGCDTFVCNSFSGYLEGKGYEDLLDHEFVALSRGFDCRNRESYIILGRMDV